MNFADIETTVQEDIIEILNGHIMASASILEEDKCLMPMMMVKGESSESNQLISLVSKDGSVDVDKAYNVAVQNLKNMDFTYALFSYSTQVGLESGRLADAVKTFIFAKNGLTVVFYTPFVLKGLFKKKVIIEKTILGEVIENIFD